MIPKKHAGKSGAPALERGLMILDLLQDSPQGVSFTVMKETLQVSNATLSRLVRALMSRDYMLKSSETGLYYPGARLAVRLPETRSRPLHELAEPVLVRLRAECGNTAVLFAWDGVSTVVMNKKVHEAAVVMRAVGHRTDTMCISPWDWILYGSLSRSERNQLPVQVSRPVFERHLRDGLQEFRRRGYAYDDQCGIQHVRRMAAPLYDADGRLLGCLALGGNPLTMPDGAVETMGRMLRDGADELSARFGWKGEEP
jgi:DNA-binding IclR family transcriptional regulator